MSTGPWHIEKLALTGKDETRVELEFPTRLSLVYGASNTGKSFAVKTLDFILGGSRELPDISERTPYDTGWLNLTFGSDSKVLLKRALRGGDIELVDGAVSTILTSRHNAASEDNLSNHLLGRMNARGKEIAKDKSGTKKPLSFRDLVRFCIADETSILGEMSPAESGEVAFAPTERNVFKFMITGEDDSALITRLKPKDYATGRTAQVRILEEMIATIEADLNENYPDWEKLDDHYVAIQSDLEALEREIVGVRHSVAALLGEKRELVRQISSDQQSVNDIAIGIENFKQLQNVYVSDVLRLQAIEEAGFLLGLDRNSPCPVCGAPAEAQQHSHGYDELDRARAAAEIEIAKIGVHQTELAQTITDAMRQLEVTVTRLQNSQSKLESVEAQLRASSPSAEEHQAKFIDIIPKRDRINRGLELIVRKTNLEKQKAVLEKAKQRRVPSNFQYGLSTTTANEFADEVSSVLAAWGFPGERKVFFDLETFDLIIDGKRRRDNGKGVRAITHAAFKVAMMTYCRSRGLPHPGFLVMDSALITYRDPITSRAGALSSDEQAIRGSGLKELMFEHLAGQEHGQVILFDNVDPPSNENVATIVQFTNSEIGRRGLL